MEIAVDRDAAATRCSILVVDDAAPARAALGEWLRAIGYVVFEAADADQALTLLNSRLDIAVMITDVQMPGSMDGIALAQWVHKTRPSLRVLVLSGVDTGARLAGDDIAFFCKPPAQEQLLAALPSTEQRAA